MNRDNIYLGIAFGILLPVVALYLYAGIWHARWNPVEAVEYFKEAGVLVNLIKLGALVNLPVFFVFLNINKHKTAKGILLSTLFIALSILFLSFT